MVGSAHNITWTSTGTIANVKIESSTDSGSSYTTVIASTANNGSYVWTIPNTPSTTCLVRVSDASNAAVNDVSNAVFSIVSVTISGTVTSGGTALASVVMSGLPGNPQTNAQGQYTATVNYGWSGTVTPTLAGYTFIPPSTTYTNVTSNQTTNYTSTVVTYTISGTVTSGGNPLASVVMSGLPGNPQTKARASTRRR